MKKSLLEAIQEIRPVLEAMLAAEQIPPDQAEELLSEVLNHLCFKHPGVKDPGAWLVQALRRALERRDPQHSGNGHHPLLSPPP